MIKTFGESILNEDKSIDRKKLAEIVFTSDEKDFLRVLFTKRLSELLKKESSFSTNMDSMVLLYLMFPSLLKMVS